MADARVNLTTGRQAEGLAGPTGGAGLPAVRFVWHPAARLFDGTGRAHQPVAETPVAGTPVAETPVAIAERPPGPALVQAFAAGPAFRIGGGDGPPEAADMPMLETLTSGSSGAPRRIRRSQASWIASFAVNAGLFGLGPGVRVAVLGGLAQSLALYGAVEGLHLGAEVHLLGGLRPDRQRHALVARRVEVVYAAPAQLRLLTEAPGAACPALRLMLVGGSRLDPALAAALGVLASQAEQREFYGAAETSFVTLTDAQTPTGSVGRAYPGVEISLRSGQIWVRSPYLFQGYAGNEPGGAIRADGWLSVGEMGRIEDGCLYLSGRAGRMVTVADQNVFPEEIESFMTGLCGVTRVAVLPRPDVLRGVALVAVVMGDAGCSAAILAALRAEFGPLKAPKALIWRQDWPVLGSGKTDLRALAQAIG